MGVGCNNRWRNDGKFVKFHLPKDKSGEEYIPFCMHPSHMGLVADADYRLKKCEKNGKGIYCKYYRMFRDVGQPGELTESLEVSVRYQSSSAPGK